MMPAPAALRIAAGFTMPSDAVTQTIGIIAKRNAGKTHTGVVLTEELLDAGAQVVVLDPLGVWWGLRSSIDGKGKGYAVVVFGGDHGDLPLTEDMGAQIANAIVDHRLSAVLDLSALTKAATRRFAAAFFEQLYHAKGAEGKRTPLHLVLDEADVFAPQRVQPDETRMLGAVDSIVRRGRTRGFGVTMITQRPATISKDVFTQIEVLVALQLVSPQDRKAVDEWVQANGTPEQRAEFMRSLASLERGQAWVWSPSWLKVFKLVQIRQRRTFDSSRTPTAGEQPIAPPRELAQVDLDRLQESMKAALEKVKANDPELLKKRIAELEKQLRSAGAVSERSVEDVARLIGSSVTARDSAWLEAVDRGIDAFRAAAKLSPFVPVNQPAALHRATVQLSSRPPRVLATCATTVPRVRGIGAGDGNLSKGERAVLTVLAQFEPESVTARKAALLAGYSLNSSTWRNILSRLRNDWGEPLIDGGASAMTITGRGHQMLGEWAPLPTGEALLDHWRRELGDGCARMLFEALVHAHPRERTKEELASASGYSAESSTFRNGISKLSTLELIVGRGDTRRLSPELMESA